MPEPRLLYWDACVFLSYIEDDPDRVPTLEDIIAEVHASRGKIEIITSTFSIAEVAFAVYERTNSQLDVDVENRINNLWLDSSMFKVVEFHAGIARDARDLIRSVLPRAPGLKPKDAVHIATAQRMGAYEFHTYDSRLFKYSSDVGFSICSPKPFVPTLFSSTTPD